MNEDDDIIVFIDKYKKVYDKYEIVKKNINFEELKTSLLELDKIIEMNQIKSAIIKQIEVLTVLIIKSNEYNRFDNHILHTVFYGNPGVGKSRIAKILANIWKSLGILSHKSNENKINDKDILSKISDIKNLYNGLYNKFQIPDSKESKKMWKNNQHDWDILRQKINMLENLKLNKIDSSVDKIIITAGREDFVAEYAGQTSIKSYNFLKSCLGKCVIIEEAYVLYTGESDTYGIEALTVLNRFMDEYASSIAVIFTGYEDKLRDTIFKIQPGLKRRCQWIFNLKGYTEKGLSKIFISQLGDNWIIDEKMIETFFMKNFDKFTNFGGDTEKLAFICKILSGHQNFNYFLKSEVSNIEDKDFLTEKMLNEALKEFLGNSI